MRTDTLVANQLLMAQAVGALADHIANSTLFQLTAVAFSDLPTGVAGMLATITDSTVNTWGTDITVGGGGFTVLAFYNGTNWTVAGK